MSQPGDVSRIISHLSKLNCEVEECCFEIILVLALARQFFFMLIQDDVGGVPSVRDNMTGLSIIFLLASSSIYSPVCRLRKKLASKQQALQAISIINAESLPNVSEGLGWKEVFYYSSFFILTQFCRIYIDLKRSQGVRSVATHSNDFLGVTFIALSVSAYFPVCRIIKNFAARRQVPQASSNIDDESLPNVSEAIDWVRLVLSSGFSFFILAQLCANLIESQRLDSVEPSNAPSDLFWNNVMGQCLDAESSESVMCQP